MVTRRGAGAASSSTLQLTPIKKPGVHPLGEAHPRGFVRNHQFKNSIEQMLSFPRGSGIYAPSVASRNTLLAPSDEIRAKLALISIENKLFPKEALGNPCIERLPMLY